LEIGPFPSGKSVRNFSIPMWPTLMCRLRICLQKNIERSTKILMYVNFPVLEAKF